MMATAAARHQFASTSLYVGDLAPDVAEETLYEFFNSVGPVASIRVCRDSTTHRSLGYAYINYHNITDAERALDTLNFTPIRGRACRIMWSQRDPAVRKSGNGNLFVKNLDKSVDNRALYDTFSLFGNILSCKVVTDENGKSKGYGFVHFELDSAAANAIERVNGMLIGTKEVFVGPHHKQNERSSSKPEYFTNVYIRSYPASWNEEILRNILSPYGEITSLWMTTDKGRCYSCVNFKEGDSAKNALDALNGRKVNKDGLVETSKETTEQQSVPEEKTTGEDQDAAPTKQIDVEDGKDKPTSHQTDEPEEYQLYVARAQTRDERGMQMKQRFDVRQQQFKQKFDGVNLYIKNLPEKVDDAKLRQIFECFGTITSAKVMRDEEGHSKGFGFVCFTSAEEATKAISEMHLKVHDQKPLYVGLAELKERRQARLVFQHRSQANVRQPINQVGGMYNGADAMYFGGPPPPPNMNPMMPSHAPPQSAGPAMVWPGHTAAYPPAAPPNAHNMMWKSVFGSNVVPPSMNTHNGPMPGAPHMQGMMFPPHTSHVGPQHGFRTGSAAGMGPANIPQSQQQPLRMRDPNAISPPIRGHAPPNPAVAPTGAQNAALHKQLLGERLFPLVSKHQPNLAGKITGMMLDMDDSELHLLIQSETELKAKIDEAIRVLQQAQLH